MPGTEIELGVTANDTTMCMYTMCTFIHIHPTVSGDVFTLVPTRVNILYLYRGTCIVKTVALCVCLCLCTVKEYDTLYIIW